MMLQMKSLVSMTAAGKPTAAAVLEGASAAPPLVAKVAAAVPLPLPSRGRQVAEQRAPLQHLSYQAAQSSAHVLPVRLAGVDEARPDCLVGVEGAQPHSAGKPTPEEVIVQLPLDDARARPIDLLSPGAFV